MRIFAEDDATVKFAKEEILKSTPVQTVGYCTLNEISLKLIINSFFLTKGIERARWKLCLVQAVGTL